MAKRAKADCGAILMERSYSLGYRREKSGGSEVRIDQAQTEYSVACLPEHLLARSRARQHVFDDLYMLFDPVWDRTVIGPEHHSVHTAHFDRGAQPDRVEPHAVHQDVGLEIVGWRPLVLVRLAGRRVADPFVVKAPIEFDATEDRREFDTHMDD